MWWRRDGLNLLCFLHRKQVSFHWDLFSSSGIAAITIVLTETPLLTATWALLLMVALVAKFTLGSAPQASNVCHGSPPSRRMTRASVPGRRRALSGACRWTCRLHNKLPPGETHSRRSRHRL